MIVCCSAVEIPVYLRGSLVIFAKMSTCRLVIIFGSTNAPTPVGLLAGKGSRCRDFLAFRRLRTASYFDVDSLFNRKLDPSRKGK